MAVRECVCQPAAVGVPCEQRVVGIALAVADAPQDVRGSPGSVVDPIEVTRRGGLRVQATNCWITLGGRVRWSSSTARSVIRTLEVCISRKVYRLAV